MPTKLLHSSQREGGENKDLWLKNVLNTAQLKHYRIMNPLPSSPKHFLFTNKIGTKSSFIHSKNNKIYWQ